MWEIFLVSVLFASNVFANEPGELGTLASLSTIVESTAPRDSCRDILADGIFDSFLFKNDSSSYALIKEMMCTESSNSISGGARAKLIFDFFPVKGDASFNKNYWKKECQNYESQHSQEERQFLLTRKANTDAVDAWKACMRQRTNSLFCWAQVDDESRVLVHFDYPLGNPPLYVKDPVGMGNLSYVGNPNFWMIYPGNETVFLSKVDPEKSALFLVNAYNDYNRVSCHVGIPASVPKKRNSDSPKWCAKIYSENDYGGAEYTFQANEDGVAHNVTDLRTIRFADDISSVKVHPGCKFKGYEEVGLLGRQFATGGDVPDFRYLRRDLGNGNYADWNNMIKAAKCFCSQ